MPSGDVHDQHRVVTRSAIDLTFGSIGDLGVNADQDIVGSGLRHAADEAGQAHGAKSAAYNHAVRGDQCPEQHEPAEAGPKAAPA